MCFSFLQKKKGLVRFFFFFTHQELMNTHPCSRGITKLIDAQYENPLNSLDKGKEFISMFTNFFLIVLLFFFV